MKEHKQGIWVVMAALILGACIVIAAVITVLPRYFSEVFPRPPSQNITSTVQNPNISSGYVYDLSNDWSDTRNPNGVWRLYKATGQLFTVNQPDWYNNGTGQPAWADAPYPEAAHVPVWMKTHSDMGELFHPLEEDYMGFVEAGQVVAHGAESGRTGTEFTSVTWTSPVVGLAQISGGAWIAKAYNRPMVWELRKNGALLSQGVLTQTDLYTKSNPFDFANGSGGTSVLKQPVTQNDVIELLVYRQSRTSYATFVAVEFRITVIPKP